MVTPAAVSILRPARPARPAWPAVRATAPGGSGWAVDCKSWEWKGAVFGKKRLGGSGYLKESFLIIFVVYGSRLRDFSESANTQKLAETDFIKGFWAAFRCRATSTGFSLCCFMWWMFSMGESVSCLSGLWWAFVIIRWSPPWPAEVLCLPSWAMENAEQDDEHVNQALKVGSGGPGSPRLGVGHL